MGKGKEHKGIRWLVAAIVLLGLGLGLSAPASGYDSSVAKYTWDGTVPNYNPTAVLYPGVINTTDLVMGDFLGISPTQPNAPSCGDSGVVVNWDDNWAGGGNGNTNGDQLDGKWVQIVYPVQGWWDLGSETNRIAVFLSQDHGPYLAEGLEYRIYGSNTLWGEASSQAILQEVYLDGWRVHNPDEDNNKNGWLSDDIAAVYELPGSYRYIKLVAWTSKPDLNEPEVDAVARVKSGPDFSVNEIKPIQVVWNADVNNDGKTDLVAEKATMVRVSIGMENYDVLNKSQLVDVKLQFNGVDYSESRTIEELELANRTVDFYPAPPTAPGDQKITAIVDPENKVEEANETNNVNFTEITVKTTKGLHIAYFRVERPEDYGTVAEYDETVEKSGEFIQATYPVSDTKFVNEERQEVIKGAKITFLWWKSWLLSARADCSEVAKTAKRLGTDRGVGVVPENYFEFWGVPWARGQSFPGIKGGVIALTGYWTPGAHEIGHTYGLKDQYGDDYSGNPASGFWVSKKLLIDNKTSFMGEAEGARSYNKTWIDNESYNELFKKFRDKNDPEILIVDGLIYKNGTIELGKWYKAEGRDDLEEISDGNYSLELLDKDGNVLQKTNFSAQFWTNVIPGGVVETDFAAFTFAVPYPANGSAVKIVRENELITEVDLADKLLGDSMASLPEDYDTLLKLVKGSDIQKQTKKILLAKLKVAKKLAKSGISDIQKGRNFSAKIKLQISSMLVEEFVKEVNNWKGSEIPENDAKQFITWAEKMILEPQYQIIDSLKPKLPIPPTPPPCQPTLPSKPLQILPCPQQPVMPATTDTDIVNISDADIRAMIKNEMENINKEDI